MSRATFFLRACPVCGRRLQIRIQFLGRNVQCRHCAAEFVAQDPKLPESSSSDSGPNLLHRAEELLASYEELRHRPR